MSEKRTRQQRWVAGDALSWGLGVTLGLILGVALLILTPQLMAGQNQAAAEGTVRESTQAQGGTEGEATTSSGGGGTAENTQVPAPVQGTQETLTGDGTTGTENTSQKSGTPPANEPAGNETTGETTGEDTGEDTSATTATTTDNAAAGMAGGMTGSAAAAGDATAGQTLFASSCGGCHGANAQGSLGPSLVGEDGPKSWTLEQFAGALYEGRTPERELAPTMPRFSKEQISDQQLADIHAYLKSL